MKSKKMKHLFLGVFLGAMLMSPQAFAADYIFEGEAPGAAFHPATESGIAGEGTHGDITVGSDGNVYPGFSDNDVTDPFDRVDLPIGEYPESYGVQTDMDIAANSVFPNEAGPTTQTENCYHPHYEGSVSSGSLPTGAEEPGGSTWIPAGTPQGNSGFKAGAVARLEIPLIGLSEWVYEGESTASMKKGVGHFSCTPLTYGNIALAGHNRGSHPAFGKLHKLYPGAVVFYETALGVRRYRVTEVKTVSVTDTSGLLQNGRETLSLYTCIANRPSVKLLVRAEAM